MLAHYRLRIAPKVSRTVYNLLILNDKNFRKYMQSGVYPEIVFLSTLITCNAIN